jgi:hypothetical protein
MLIYWRAGASGKERVSPAHLAGASSPGHVQSLARQCQLAQIGSRRARAVSPAAQVALTSG